MGDLSGGLFNHGKKRGGKWVGSDNRSGFSFLFYSNLVTLSFSFAFLFFSISHSIYSNRILSIEHLAFSESDAFFSGKRF